MALPVIGEKLAKMAEGLIDKANEETAVDVFKCVSTWHIAMLRQMKQSGDSTAEDSFAAMKDRLGKPTSPEIN